MAICLEKWLHFCGKSAAVDNCHPERTSVSAVATIQIREKLLECCDKRCDSWAAEIQVLTLSLLRLFIISTVNRDSCYLKVKTQHQQLKLFKISGDIKKYIDLKCCAIGWNQKVTQICTRMQNCMVRWLNLVADQRVILSRDSNKSCKNTINNTDFLAKVKGCRSIVCFRNIAKFIISDKWYLEKKDDIDLKSEKVNIILIHIHLMMT